MNILETQIIVLNKLREKLELKRNSVRPLFRDYYETQEEFEIRSQANSARYETLTEIISAIEEVVEEMK